MKQLLRAVECVAFFLMSVVYAAAAEPSIDSTPMQQFGYGHIFFNNITYTAEYQKDQIN